MISNLKTKILPIVGGVLVGLAVLLPFEFATTSCTAAQGQTAGGVIVANAGPLVVASCAFVPAPYGSVCADAAPLVVGIINTLIARLTARLTAIDPASCARAQITADGRTVIGAMCVEVCGDMSRATPSDPCPAVDEGLRKAASK